MHVVIAQDLGAISAQTLGANSINVERLLQHHQASRLLFCLTPSQVDTISKHCDLGARAKGTLSIIRRRYQDYFSSFRRSLGHYRVFFDSDDKGEVPPNVFKIAISDVERILDKPPVLFVENAMNDGWFYTVVFEIIIHEEIGTAKLTKVTPFHGGGSTLAGAIDNEFGAQAKGVCICDRDKAGDAPPLRANSTGAAVYDILRSRGIIDDNLLPTSKSPLFHFGLTCGWSIENYISPKLYDFCLNLIQNSHVWRSSIQTAFPTFPHLTESEFFQWLCVNFRKADQEPEQLKESLLNRFGETISDEHAQALAALMMPSDAFKVAVEVLRSGRYARAARAAFLSDYRRLFRTQALSLSLHAKKVHSALAGDCDMALA